MSLIRSSNIQDFKYDFVVFDLNGTLANYGKINPSTQRLLTKLTKLLPCYLLTWDQRGNAHRYEQYWLKIQTVTHWTEKGEFVEKLMQQGSVVAVGNARIDSPMFIKSDLALWVIGPEWFHTWAYEYIDVLFTNINHAIHFLIDEDVFAATMKE
jgi:soluble P-type ATPase